MTALQNQLQILADELSLDPLGIGYDQDAATAAGQLNAKAYPGDVETATIARLLFESGSLGTVLDAAEGRDTFTDQQRSVAARVKFVLQVWDEIETADDTKRATFEAQLDALIGLSLIAAGDKTAILAAYADGRSRADQLGLPPVGSGRVLQARAL